MAVAVELQTERRPGGDAQVDQPEMGVHEVEIVVQALAAVRPDEGLVRLLVVPGLIGVAGFHGRDDVYQPGTVAALLQDPRHHILLADIALADVLDRQPRLAGQRGGAVAHTVSQRLGKLGVVEDADTTGIEIPGHPVRIANSRQCPGDHHPVVARQHTGDPIVVAVRQRLAHAVPRQVTLSPGKATPNLLVPAPPA